MLTGIDINSKKNVYLNQNIFHMNLPELTEMNPCWKTGNVPAYALILMKEPIKVRRKIFKELS